MKAEYLNPFVHATRNVLETMAQTKLTGQKPHLKEGVSTYGDVTGIIGMASETVEGSMTISFPAACILQIVSRMLMEEPKTTIDNDIVDAVGEITNMICGGAKAEFGKLGMSFNLATPTMVTGKGWKSTITPTCRSSCSRLKQTAAPLCWRLIWPASEKG